ncbi:MAG: M1 family aminopeptidase [Thermoanaerobaculia bacterium]
MTSTCARQTKPYDTRRAHEPSRGTLRVALVVALLLAVPVVAIGSESPVGLFDAYGHPKLGPAGPASGETVKISNLTLKFDSGSIAPVIVGTEPIGLFFRGKGSFSYQSVDPRESGIVLFEAKKLDRKAKKNGDGSVTLSGQFERLYLMTGGIALPEVKPGQIDGGPLADAFREHREEFKNVRWTPPAHLIARQRIDEPASPVAVALFSGSGRFGYVLDTIDAREERLYALITQSGLFDYPELRDALFPVRISEQPVGRKREDFLQPRFLLVDLDYTLVAGEKAEGKLSITETLLPRRVPQSVFRFDLLSGVWDSDGKYRRFNIDSVTDESGAKLPFEFDHDSVIVRTAAKQPVDEPVVIRFEISGDFLFRPDNDSFWQLGTEAWYPQNDWNGQYATVHSVVKVKKPWVAFAPGTTVGRREEGEFNVLESLVEKPVQYTVVHAGRYLVYEEKFGDLTIRVAPYAIHNERAMKQLASLSNRIIRFYETFLGPFPFKELNIIEINDLGFGQAPPGTMFITREAFNPLIDIRSRVYSKGINQRFAHEIAHQYWGHVVKKGSAEEQWLSEAFAEYCSALVVKEIDGEGGYNKLVAEWRGDADRSNDVASIAMANRIAIPSDPGKAGEHRFDLLYSKGAYILAALRKEVGEEKFLLFLRNLQGQYAWRFVTTKDVAIVMQRIDGGKDYKPFFERYYWGTEMPKMEK